MKRTVRALAAGVSLLACCVVQAQEVPTVEDFAHLPTFRSLSISPDGTKALGLANIDNAYALAVFDLSSGSAKMTFSLQESEEYKVRNPLWARSDRLLFSLQFAHRRGTTDTTETRLMAAGPDGSDVLWLFEKEARDLDEGEFIDQVQDRVVSLLPDDPEFILLQYFNYKTGVMDVRKVHVDDARTHILVQKGRNDILSWGADTNGEVRIGWGADNSSAKLHVRLEGGKWIDISHRVAEGAPDFELLDVSDRKDLFYVLATNGEETTGLYLYDPDADKFAELVYRNPDADIEGIVLDDLTGAVEGVYYAGDEDEVDWLAETQTKATLDLLSRSFKNKNVTITDVNQTGTNYVFRLDDVSDPGSYILFDRVNKGAIQLPQQYPGLTGKPLGKVVTTSYEARDGLEIPAYVTLPPGVGSMEEAQDLPFVLMPHGGPHARSFASFDYWAQFLATRGYGVLQMNFRGSSGYGREFQKAGERQWGQLMQDDITDGAGWLVEQGYADADRLAIMGGSYGGYAALMGAVKTPDLYQCAISFAGVSDLPELIRDERQYIGGRYAASRYIGKLWSDGETLRENSPAQRADAIRIPILLMHGDTDRVVSVTQSRMMERALKRENKDVTYIELEGGDHFLNLYRNRLAFLQETERFLDGCL